jgi:hypothetical protein
MWPKHLYNRAFPFCHDKGSFAIALTLELIGLKRPKTMNPCRAWTDGVSSLRAFVSSSFFLAWAVNFIVSSFVIDIGATWVVVGDYLDEICDARLLQAKGEQEISNHMCEAIASRTHYCKDFLADASSKREQANKLCAVFAAIASWNRYYKDFLAARRATTRIGLCFDHITCHCTDHINVLRSGFCPRRAPRNDKD